MFLGTRSTLKKYLLTEYMWEKQEQVTNLDPSQILSMRRSKSMVY